MGWEELITVTPGVRSGKPCVRGTRITVQDVLEYLAAGMTEAQVLSDFPSLTSIQASGDWAPVAAQFSWLAGFDRMVIDKRGLSGEFDVNLKWTPQELSARTDVRNPALQASDAPTLFAALQDQLGLKLEASRGPVEMIVIESVERPTPD